MMWFNFVFKHVDAYTLYYVLLYHEVQESFIFWSTTVWWGTYSESKCSKLILRKQKGGDTSPTIADRLFLNHLLLHKSIAGRTKGTFFSFFLTDNFHCNWTKYRLTCHRIEVCCISFIDFFNHQLSYPLPTLERIGSITFILKKNFNSSGVVRINYSC